MEEEYLVYTSLSTLLALVRQITDEEDIERVLEYVPVMAD